METTTRMCFAHTNICKPDVVIQIALDNVAALGTWPALNLRVEDPWTAFKTGTPTGEPAVRMDLGAQRAFNAIGFVHHNVNTGFPDGVVIEGSNTAITGAWTNIDFWATAGSADHDTLLRLSGSPSFRYVRLRFQKTGGGWPAFEIGMLFIGTWFEVTLNPKSYNMVFEPFVRTRRTAGGAMYVLRGSHTRKPKKVEISWKLAPQGQTETVEQKLLGQLGASIGPGSAASVTPLGLPHFFGYFHPAAAFGDQSWNANDHRWETTLVGEGVT